MNEEADVELLDKVRRGLTEQCDKLPDTTQRRLQVARRAALADTAPQRRFLDQTILGMPLVPLSGALSVGVLGFALLVSPGGVLDDDAGFAERVSDTDVLMSNEDMEFLENLELYEWLDAEYG